MLIHELGRTIDRKYSNLTLPLIKAALQGIPVDPTARVPGTTTPYSEYLEQGFFLNTPSDPTANPGDLDAYVDRPTQVTETPTLTLSTPTQTT
jgi:hypothetical protein